MKYNHEWKVSRIIFLYKTHLPLHTYINTRTVKKNQDKLYTFNSPHILLINTPQNDY